MHKVVIERPRWNPGPSKRGRRDNLTDELLPKFEGIKRPHAHRKGLTDLLGPLKRWLQSQVDRPWNDVYSEACAVIKPDSIIRAHVKTHLLQFVERNTFMHGGKVCILDTGYLGRGVVPVTERRYYKSSRFFVHPESGLLCVIPQQPRLRRFDPNADRRAQLSRWVSETSVLRQLHGCWFECCLSPFPRRFAKGESPWRFDVAEKKLICRSIAHEVYAKPVYCTTKRQLSRRELKRYGLRNDSTSRVQLSIGYFCCRLKAALCLSAVRTFKPQPLTMEVVWQITRSIQKTARFFEITSKRRKGFPSETQVKRGFRVVHVNKELQEKLGRNDPCPCGSAHSF